MKLCVIAYNIRSAHNIGSLFRTCEGLGVGELFICGYSPYPQQQNDVRLPHIAQKASKEIHKTALGAETYLPWHYSSSVTDTINNLKKSGYTVVCLEQDKNSQPLESFQPKDSVALLLGNEVEGIESAILNKADTVVEVPMHGKKESFNVVIAGALAIYHILNNQ